MDRSIAKFAAALLVGSSLSACSTLGVGSGSTDTSAPKTAVKGNTSAHSMAADLDTQIHSAQALRASGDYAGATKALGQLMLVTPDDPRVVAEYGKTLVLAGRSKEALDFLKRAMQLAPGDYSVYSAVGVAYDQQGDYTSARAAYTQALALKPGDAGVLNNYALSRMQAGDAAGARQLMAQAQVGGASDPRIAQNVALIDSYAPAPASAPAAAPLKTTAMAGNKATPVVVHAIPKMPSNVVMEQVPTDSKAGPVREATGAPHQLAKPAPSSTAPHQIAKAAPPVVQKSVAKTTAAPIKAAAHKTAVAADVKKKQAPASNKTPALRMTADAATP
jgi:Flp pilus assembly protein TadD